MATTEKTPLWLDLKKEYIDDNFEKLQAYLSDSDEKGSKDAFYATTIELFRERITDLLRDISERPVFADEQERQIIKRTSVCSPPIYWQTVIILWHWQPMWLS